MPHLERLINEGVMGNLATLRPSSSHALDQRRDGEEADSHGVYASSSQGDGRGVRRYPALTQISNPLVHSERQGPEKRGRRLVRHASAAGPAARW